MQLLNLKWSTSQRISLEKVIVLASCSMTEVLSDFHLNYGNIRLLSGNLHQSQMKESSRNIAKIKFVW